MRTLSVHDHFRYIRRSVSVHDKIGTWSRSVHRYILAERCYVTFGLWYVPSVCRLALMSLMFARPDQWVELFGSISAPSNSSGSSQRGSLRVRYNGRPIYNLFVIASILNRLTVTI